MMRKASESGFYHVVTKGDGGQIIFEGRPDRADYLACMKRALEDNPVNVHAYCLMSNHVHLVLEDLDNGMSKFMKEVDELYAVHFNTVTGRDGHLFQSRFWSEPIDTDEYFLAAIRYIHANPEVAGICQASDYPWSSYKAYTHGSTFVATKLALSLLGGVQAFVAFQSTGGRHAKPFRTSKLKAHLSPDEQTRIALALLGRETLLSLKALKRKDRKTPIEKLARAGLTGSEIARITGISQPSIHRLLHDVA